MSSLDQQHKRTLLQCLLLAIPTLIIGCLVGAFIAKMLLWFMS